MFKLIKEIIGIIEAITKGKILQKHSRKIWRKKTKKVNFIKENMVNGMKH